MSLRDHFINGAWHAGAGDAFHSVNPETDEPAFEARHATADEVDAAFVAAGEAAADWRDRLFLERAERARRFAEEVKRRTEDFAAAISRETGKPLWESRTEVASVIAKVAISIQAYQQRTGETRSAAGEATAVLRHRPHGVVGVLGPFNFPAHSAEWSHRPGAAGRELCRLQTERIDAGGRRAPGGMLGAQWLAAGRPECCPGARETAEFVVNHPALDGLYFTGSATTGLALHRKFAGRPEVILALEMGGNNPLIICDVADFDASAVLTILSAFQTAGQRCTCARRLIVVENEDFPAILKRLIERIRAIKIGYPGGVEDVFCGPVIHNAAADRIMGVQDHLVRAGGVSLVPVTRPNPAKPLLRPGLIDVTNVSRREDEEIFGPLLQLIRVPDFAAALAEANATRFGLAAA